MVFTASYNEEVGIKNVISPSFLYLFLGHLLLNPLIWRSSAMDVQCNLIAEVHDEITASIRFFKAEQLLCILLRSLQLYVTLGPDKYHPVLNTLQELSAHYLLNRVKRYQVRHLLPYLNVYYMRRLDNYPALLVRMLKLLLSFYLAHRKAFASDVHEEVRETKDSGTLASMLVIVGYVMHHLESAGEESKTAHEKFAGSVLGSEELKALTGKKTVKKDSILLKYCRDHRETLDEIVGISLYILLDFDWHALALSSKHAARSFVFASRAKALTSLTKFLVSHAEKHKTDIESYVLESLFPERGRHLGVLGRVSLKAIAAVAFGNPKVIVGELGLKVEVGKREMSKTKSKSLFTFMLKQASQRFTKEANEELIHILQSEEQNLKKTIQSEDTMKCILAIPEITENQTLERIQSCLWHNISPACPHLWQYLHASPGHKLSVLHSALASARGSVEKEEPSTALRCIDFAYALEDIYEKSFVDSKLDKTFIKNLALLLLFANEAQLLYSSMPPWKIFDNRAICAAKKGAVQEIEGGILRILLKLVLIACKQKHAAAYSMLRFIISRKQGDKEAIKRLLDSSDENLKSEKKEVKEKKEKNNMMGILSRKEEVILQLQLRNSFISKKVIEERFTLLSECRVKSQALNPNTENFFMTPQTLTLYLVVSLLQLIYFEVFQVDSHSKFPQTEKELNNFREAKEAPLTENYASLIKILKEVMWKQKEERVKRILDIYLKTDGDVTIGKMLDSMHDLEPAELNFYSDLDRVAMPRTHSPSDKTSKYGFPQLATHWEGLSSALVGILNKSSEIKEISKELLPILLKADYFFLLYPRLRFLVSYPFHKLAVHISKEKQPPSIASADSKFLCKLWTKFSQIKIPKEMFERDTVDENFERVAGTVYNRAMQDQYSALGCWHTKHRNSKALLDYVSKQYEKLLNRCPLYQMLKESGEYVKGELGEFVRLSMKRDSIGRALILKGVKSVKALKWYGYLKLFVLKKMLIKQVCSKRMPAADLFAKDFEFKLTKDLFENKYKNGWRKEGVRERKFVVEAAKSVIDEEEYEIIDVRKFHIDDYLNSNEFIPKSMKVYDIELIRIDGSCDAKLYLSENCIFLYRMPEPSFDGENAKWKLSKWWRAKDVKEIVVTPCNFTIELIEIFFHNSASLLFSLLEPEAKKSFMGNLTKYQEVKLMAGAEKESYIEKLTKMWRKGKISNFRYLMFLNKYAGRSFNSLERYPVLPWVIKDFKSNRLDLSSKDTYYDLNVTKSEANSTFQDTISGKEDLVRKGRQELAPQTVLNYMVRLEPYSLLIQPGELQTFHDIAVECEDRLTTRRSNLTIPEFYYLPELCVNHNKYSLGLIPGLNSRIDQVVLPSWAGDYHKFVHVNSLALDSSQVSARLHEWIDLVFGNKQSDDHGLCLHTRESREEMEEQGTKLARLFNEDHPRRDLKLVERASKNMLLNYYENDSPHSFILTEHDVVEEAQPIIFLETVQDRLIFITSSQKLHITHRITALEEDKISLKKSHIELFPFKSFYDPAARLHKCDAQRCFATKGDLLITCRHYDNSWKVFSYSGNIERSVQFHKAMVNCVCVSDSGGRLFTASKDGVVAAWQLPQNDLAWYAKSHGQKVTSMDISERLGTVASVSIDGTVTVRRVHDGSLLRVIDLRSKSEKSKFLTGYIRLSYRGYIVVAMNLKGKEGGCIFVYSINGELISKKDIMEFVNAVVMSKGGDEFVVGGVGGSVVKYDLFSLEEKSMLENVEGDVDATSLNLTFMNLTTNKGPQQLLLGTSTGILYSLRINNDNQYN